MKRYTYIAIAAITMLSACSQEETTTNPTQDVPALQKEKAILIQQKNELTQQIRQLENKIQDQSGTANQPLVSVLQLEPKDFSHYLEAPGNIKSKKNTIVYPEISGMLEEIFVQEGQWVNKGQLLAQINDGGFAQRVNQLEIQRDLAKTQFERQSRLWEEKIGSEMQYLEAKSHYEMLEKSLEQIQEEYKKAEVRAPFSGRIDHIISQEGDMVNPTSMSALFRLVDLKDMYVEAEISEQYLGQIQEGNKVEVFIPVLQTQLASTLSLKGHHINETNRSFRIEAKIKNPDELIKPNLRAALKINDYNNPAAILIPQQVIQEDRKLQQYVFLVKENAGKRSIHSQAIKTGKKQGDLVEVTHGLQGGDLLVIDGYHRLKEGQVVQTITK